MRVIFFLALRQLWDRKLLSGIAVLGVSLGVLVLIAMSGIMLGFRYKFLDNMLRANAHVTILDRELHPQAPLLQRAHPELVATEVAHQAPSDRQSRIKRPGELSRAIAAMGPGVIAAPSVGGSAVISFGPRELPVEVRGIDPAAQDRVTPLSSYVVAGRYQTFQASADGILLGAGAASRIGAHLDDVLRIGSPKGEVRSVKVVGIVDTGIPPIDNSRVYLPLRTAQQVLGRPDAVARLEVHLPDPERAPEVAARLEAISGYDAESWQETNANFLGLFGIQNRITGFVIGSILLVGGFGILAIQIMIVLQKTRDISILRSVGFQRRDILSIFLLQGAIVALVGGLVGDLAGYAVCRLLARTQVHMESFVKAESFLVHDPPVTYVAGLVFALVIGMLASYLPARRAAQVEPVDVLRGMIG